MSKIKNGGLDQCGAEPFEHQQLRKAGVEGVKVAHNFSMPSEIHRCVFTDHHIVRFTYCLRSSVAQKQFLYNYTFFLISATNLSGVYRDG